MVGPIPAMVESRKTNAKSLAAGHCFVIFLGVWLYLMNVLNTATVRQVCGQPDRSDPRRQQGRGILGVVDGFPRNFEKDDDIAWRKNLLRQIG